MDQLQRCNICNEVKPINLFIFGKYICSDCEQKIIKAKVGEKRYKMLMKALKKITDDAVKQKSV